jgi:hypothetical protein
VQPANANSQEYDPQPGWKEFPTVTGGGEEQNGLVLVCFALVADTPIIFVCQCVCLCRLVLCFFVSCLLPVAGTAGGKQRVGRKRRARGA